MRAFKLLTAPLRWLASEVSEVVLAIALLVLIVVGVLYFPEGRPILLAAALVAYLVAVAALYVAWVRGRRRRGEIARP